MREMWNAYKMLVTKSEKKIYFEDLGKDVNITKWILKK
jgi:hypothetical protein